MKNPSEIIKDQINETVSGVQEIMIDSTMSSVIDEERIDQVIGSYTAEATYKNDRCDLIIDGQKYENLNIIFNTLIQVPTFIAMINYSNTTISFLNEDVKSHPRVLNQGFKLIKCEDHDGSQLELDDTRLKEAILQALEDHQFELISNALLNTGEQYPLREKIDNKELVQSLTNIQSPLQATDRATRKSVQNQTKHELDRVFNRVLANYEHHYKVGILKNTGHIAVKKIMINESDMGDAVILVNKEHQYIDDDQTLQDVSYVQDCAKMMANVYYNNYINSPHFKHKIETHLNAQLSQIQEQIQVANKDIKVDEIEPTQAPLLTDRDQYTTEFKTTLTYRLNNSELYTWFTRVDLRFIFVLDIEEGKIRYFVHNGSPRLGDYEINDEESNRSITTPITEDDLDQKGIKVSDERVSEENELREKAKSEIDTALENITQQLEKYQDVTNF